MSHDSRLANQIDWLGPVEVDHTYDCCGRDEDEVSYISISGNFKEYKARRLMLNTILQEAHIDNKLEEAGLDIRDRNNAKVKKKIEEIMKDTDSVPQFKGGRNEMNNFFDIRQKLKEAKIMIFVWEFTHADTGVYDVTKYRDYNGDGAFELFTLECRTEYIKSSRVDVENFFNNIKEEKLDPHKDKDVKVFHVMYK